MAPQGARGWPTTPATSCARSSARSTPTSSCATSTRATIVRRHITEAMEDEDDDEPAASARRGQRPLEDGETPPYDVDAT